MKAVEFFSGIGAFAYAAREFGIELVAAFDQSEDANKVYKHNFGMAPSSRNLDSIKADEIPKADLWWLSPPCKPYTIRGARRDQDDPRAQSLARVIELLGDKLPRIVIVENVFAFENSAMYQRLVERLRELEYAVQTVHLCSTMFGVPMKRPRVFVVARLGGGTLDIAEPIGARLPIDLFLNCDNTGGRLDVPRADVTRHENSMNIISAQEHEYAICFTSGYDVSYRASGSFIRYGDDGRVRRFDPEEILGLLGFGPDFEFPADMPLRTCWRLAGNSVDVRCIRHLLSSLEADAAVVKNDHDSTSHR
jgi:site-specific DNA-cytosine methylase